MQTQILDGKKIAQQILLEIKNQVSALTFRPVFCDILVGEDPVSAQYVNMKAKKAESLGIKFQKANFPSDITTQDLVKEIEKLNQEKELCGLIVQLPLPKHIDKKAVLGAINPEIDVDCLGEKNMQLFYGGKPYLIFPTALAVLELLKSTNVSLRLKKILVIGRGELVGRPVSFLLTGQKLQVDIMSSKTPNPDELLGNADVIITATGKAGLVTGEKIKEGCIIIDAGTSESNGGIVGDVDKDSVLGKAGSISPVPGGVGPVTVAMLLKNVLQVAKSKTFI